MSANSIREAIEAAFEVLKEPPEEAQYADPPATTVIEEGHRCRVTDPQGRELVSDMPSSVRGAGAAQSSPISPILRGPCWRPISTGLDSGLVF